MQLLFRIENELIHPISNIMTISRQFIGNQNGNIAIMFALLLPVIAGFIGASVDLSAAFLNNARISNAVDTAILAGLKVYGNKDLKKDRKAKANKAALNILQANLFDKGIKLDKFNVAFSQDGKKSYSARVNWKATSPAYFTSLFGIDSYPLSNTVVAKLPIGQAKYIDLYFMMDFSSSMGIAATPSGITQLTQKAGCAFTCHDGSNYAKIAKANGIDLRMDVVKRAVNDIAKKIKKLDSETADQYRIGLYGFTHRAWTILSPTGNMDAVNGALSRAGVQNAHTHLGAAMSYLRSVIGKQGTGSSKDDRQKMVVFLSDGLYDMPPWVYRTNTMRVADCNTGIKAQKVRLMVIYTTYEYINHWAYRRLVRPHARNLEPDMRKCASPNSFYQTRNVSDINKAFDSIFVEFVKAGGMALTQ